MCINQIDSHNLMIEGLQYLHINGRKFYLNFMIAKQFLIVSRLGKNLPFGRSPHSGDYLSIIWKRYLKNKHFMFLTNFFPISTVKILKEDA